MHSYIGHPNWYQNDKAAARSTNNNKFTDPFIMGMLFGTSWSMSSQKSSFVPILICLQSFQKNKYGSHCNLNLVMFTNFSYFLLLPKKGSTSDASGGEKETMMMGYWQQHSPETPTSFILIDVTTNTHRGGVEDGDDNENSNGYADHWVQYYNASGGGRPRQQCRRLPQGTSWMHRPW